MDNPYILSAVRTPIGRFGGAFAKASVIDLGAAAIRSALERSGVEPGEIGEVIMGTVLPAGVGQAPARQAALHAGIPASASALTINMMCGSGLRSIMLAASMIQTGEADVVIAGGMESMSHAAYVLPRRGSKLGDRQLIDTLLHDGLVCSSSDKSMGLIADELAKRENITRQQQDAYACESHRRAVAAMKQQKFANEICPVTVASTIIDRDEGPRDDTDESSLAGLSPAFAVQGTVTAGNASMISDGAAAVVLASPRFVDSKGLTPIAHIVGSAISGAAPEDLFIAPVTATNKILQRHNLRPNEIDLIEINEAFAAQVLACLKRLELTGERVNVRGGAIALGHPIGASGARVMTTLLHNMIDDDLSTGLASLCLGGGNAVATLIRR